MMPSLVPHRTRAAIAIQRSAWATFMPVIFPIGKLRVIQAATGQAVLRG